MTLRKIYLFAAALIGMGLPTTQADAQIALEFTDTTICPGTPITMCAAFSGHASSLNSDDELSDVVPIGFPFDFFGNTYTELIAGGNAYINFSSASNKNQFGPWWYGQNPAFEKNTIFVAFADWYLPNGGKIRYETFGAPGHRRFVMEWCQIPAFASGVCNLQILTTQVILYESTNVIEMHTTKLPILSGGCPTASPDERVIQGVEDETGTLSYFTTNRDPSGLLANNWGLTGVDSDARRYTPIAGTPFTYQIDSIPFAPIAVIDESLASNLTWYASTNPNIPIGTGACVSVVPTENIHYYVVKYDGLPGCGDNIVHLVDTVFIHYATKYDTLNVSICDGESYNFLGREVYKTGQYDTLFSSAAGCDSSVTLNLTVHPLPNVSMKQNPNIDLCEGDSVRIGIDHPESGTSYQWQKDGGALATETESSIMIHDAGSYVLNATTGFGCQASTFSVVVTGRAKPEAKISPLPDEVICAYDTLQLSAENPEAGFSYTWEPAKPFRNESGNEGAKVSGVFLEPTEVSLTAYNRYGCHSSDTTFVQTKPCCEVFMPTAFTPNSDGINDNFKPNLQAGQVLVSMKIYNRLGQLVYNNKNIKAGWNGRFDNGNAAPPEVYMYIIEYTCADGQLYHKKGDVSLIR